MSLTTDIHVYESRIDSTFTVYVLFEDNDAYENIHTALQNANDSIGALIHGTKHIFIDGERIESDQLSMNHILAIEAHEIAHSYLNHSKEFSEESEIEADKYAIQLLLDKGFIESAQLLQDRIKELYHIY